MYAGRTHPESEGTVLSLDRIKSDLLAQVRSDSKFSFINTRLILTTGISLRDYGPEQANDPDVVAKVLAALTAQGFTFSEG